MLNYYQREKIIKLTFEFTCFISIFATKIVIKSIIKSEMSKEMNFVNLRDYYQKLTKKEKGKLLNYLVSVYGLGYSTMVNKFAGRNEMTRTDIFLVNLAIKDAGKWM